MVAKEGGQGRSTLYYDAAMCPREALTLKTAEEFRKLEPTGKGNPEIRVKLEGGVTLSGVKELRGGHLKGGFIGGDEGQG